MTWATLEVGGLNPDAATNVYIFVLRYAGPDADPEFFTGWGGGGVNLKLCIIFFILKLYFKNNVRRTQA
jgi:hypothetical protein